MKLKNLTANCTRLRAFLIGGLALPLAGLAQDNVDLSDYTNNSYLSLKGTVESVAPNTFVLSYNDDGDQITVEMDDGDRDADAYQLLPGDEVTVYGVMDRDLFEMRKIEASSVYVEKINTFFQASAIDEEDYYVPLMTIVTATPMDASGNTTSGNASSNSSTSNNTASNSTAGNTAAGNMASTPMPLLWIQGEVSNVQGDSFDLAMGDKDVTVNVASLSDNPLDDMGYRSIEAGDVVSVLGNIDGSFLDEGQFEANSVAKIHDKEDL